MAIKTLTTTGSFSNLSISGTTTKTGNITWTAPNLTDGATITSTTLTATLTHSMTRGSATTTINGTSYTGSNSLSIDLGTSLKSSLSVSSKGTNKNSTGTVSISNIVYTVTYDDGMYSDAGILGDLSSRPYSIYKANSSSNDPTVSIGTNSLTIKPSDSNIIAVYFTVTGLKSSSMCTLTFKDSPTNGPYFEIYALDKNGEEVNSGQALREGRAGTFNFSGYTGYNLYFYSTSGETCSYTGIYMTGEFEDISSVNNIKIGSSIVNKLYLGTSQILKAYLGNILLYSYSTGGGSSSNNLFNK